MNEIPNLKDILADADAGGDALPFDPRGVQAYVNTQSLERESATTGAIIPAMVAAFADIPNPPRNKSVRVTTDEGSYTFRYATLDKIIDGARQPLKANGLWITQPIVTIKGHMLLVTRVLHTSGEWNESYIKLPTLEELSLTKNGQRGRLKPQALGSLISFLRRYAYIAKTGIAGDEDDDANGASGNKVENLNTRQERLRDEAAARPNPRDPESVRRLVFAKAKSATSINEGIDLIGVWANNAFVLDGFRRNEDTWRGLTRETYKGLHGALGKGPADIWRDALLAANAEDAAAFQAKWKGEWAEMLGTIKGEAPKVFDALRSYAQLRVEAARKNTDTTAPKGRQSNGISENAESLLECAEEADGFEVPRADWRTAQELVDAGLGELGVPRGPDNDWRRLTLTAAGTEYAARLRTNGTKAANSTSKPKGVVDTLMNEMRTGRRGDNQADPSEQ